MASSTDTGSPLTRTDVLLVVVAALVGLVAWWMTMATAPRYSFGADQGMGNGLYYPLPLGAAAVGGWVVPARAALIGLALGAPGVLLSPWTAPRGDNDGLWILIVPLLVVFTFVSALAADLTGRLRGRIAQRS